MANDEKMGQIIHLHGHRKPSQRMRLQSELVEHERKQSARAELITSDNVVNKLQDFAADLAKITAESRVAPRYSEALTSTFQKSLAATHDEIGNLAHFIVKTSIEACTESPSLYHAAARLWLEKIRELRSQNQKVPDTSLLEAFFDAEIPERRPQSTR